MRPRDWSRRAHPLLALLLTGLLVLAGCLPAGSTRAPEQPTGGVAPEGPGNTAAGGSPASGDRTGAAAGSSGSSGSTGSPGAAGSAGGGAGNGGNSGTGGSDTDGSGTGTPGGTGAVGTDPCPIVLPERDQPAPGSSPVTWSLTSWEVPGLAGPGTAMVSFPHRFRFLFSGPVDQESVAGALVQRAEACGFTAAPAWSDPQTLDLTLEIDAAAAAKRILTYGRLLLHLTPAGGRDAQGKPLANTRTTPQLLLEAMANSSVWALDPTATDFRPTQVAALTQPYDVMSLSPNGRQYLLQLPYLPQLMISPPVDQRQRGLVFLYDSQRRLTEPLADLQGQVGHHWWPDGSLLAWNTGETGIPGAGNQVLYRSATGQVRRLLTAPRVVAVVPDPTGRRVAIFTQPAAENGSAAVDLTIADLRRNQQQAFARVARPQVGLEQTPIMAAAFSPDGARLAFWDLAGTGTAGDEATFHVWILEPETGQRVQLPVEGRRTLGPWSPDGTLLALGGVGLVNLEGEVVLPVSPYQHDMAWSPDGAYLFIQGQGILAAGNWELVRAVPGAARAGWSPGSSHLVVTGGHQVGVLALTGEWLTGYAGSDTLWSADGRWGYTPSPRGGGVILNLADSAITEVPAWPQRPGLRWVGGVPRPWVFSPEGTLLFAPHTGWKS